MHIFYLAASKNILACIVASDSTEVNSGGAVLRGVPANDPKIFVDCCILFQRIVKAVKFMTPRFEKEGAAVYIFVCIASSILSCSMIQYCSQEFSGGPSRYKSRSSVPYCFYFGMYNAESLGARSAKLSECMADDGPNREPTLVPCMALSNPRVSWKIPSAPPWEWRNKHPLMAPYNRKGEPLVLD